MDKSSRKRQWAGIGLAVGIFILTFVLWQIFGSPLVKFISDPETMRAWVEETGWASRLIFGGMVILQVIIAAIPGEPFEIAAGYAFGWAEGTVLCIVAAAIGSIITFGLVRKFGMKLVRVFFSEEKINSVKFLKTSQARNFLFLIVYMLPGTPKDLLGYFAGLTDLPFPVFCLICTLGRIPSVITSTIGGNALGTQQYGMAIVVFVITLAISGAGLLIYNRICKKHEAGSEKAAGNGEHP